MESPYNGQTGRTTSEATTVWCGGCGIWFGSSVYRTVDAETDGALIAAFLSEGFSALNMCVCPSCSWRHVAQEALAVHYPQRRQFFLYVPAAHRHRAQTIRGDFLASIEAAPGAHVPRYVFEPILVGSRTELKQLIGDERVFSRGGDEEYSSVSTDAEEPVAKGSVVRRSQTLNLLAELVGEEPNREQLEKADAELSDLAGPPTTSSHAPKEDKGLDADEEVLTTQREFDPEVGATRDDTAALGLLAAGIDRRSDTQSVVMPEGVAESVEGQSELELSDGEMLSDETLEPESVVVLDSEEFDTASLSEGSQDSVQQDEQSSEGESSADNILSVDDVEFESTDEEDAAEDEVPAHEFSAAEHKVRQPALSGSVELAADYTQELEAHSRPPSGEEAVPKDDSAANDDAQETASLHCVELTHEGVVLKSSLSTQLLEALGNRPVQVVPQLHEFEDGRVCTLTVFADSDESVAPLFWVLNEAAHRDEVLGQLEAQFCLQLDLQSAQSSQRLVAEYRFPLESNITAIKRRVEATTQIEEEAALKRLEADGAFTSGLAHGFERDSFCAINTAAEAFFALGIVEFWSDPVRSGELWGRMGFPLHWWQSIQRRVMLSAADFGLLVSPEYTSLALSILEVEDESAYLASVIDNFVEVNLRIKANGLDIVQMAQVWDGLLARAEALELPLDPEVEELASQALDRGEIALDDEVGAMDESIDAIEISLADALEVASIGGINIKDLVSFDRPTLSMVDPGFGQVGNAQLLAQLSDADVRVGSALTLVDRDAGAHAEAIYSIVDTLSIEEIAQLLPGLVGSAAEFQGHFRGGLFADAHQLRLASALYLIESKDERVINPLLAMILDPEESEWEALGLSAVVFGAAIAKPALSRVSIDASSATRVAYLLTALEKHQSGLLSNLGKLVDDASAAPCIQAAQNQVEKFENLFTDLPFSERILLTLASPSS